MAGKSLMIVYASVVMSSISFTSPSVLFACAHGRLQSFWPGAVALVNGVFAVAVLIPDVFPRRALAGETVHRAISIVLTTPDTRRPRGSNKVFHHARRHLLYKALGTATSFAKKF
jgi:hypothetical protein